MLPVDRWYFSVHWFILSMFIVPMYIIIPINALKLLNLVRVRLSFCFQWT